MKCCQTHLLRVNRLQHPQFDLFVSSNSIFYVLYFFRFSASRCLFWNNAQKSCKSRLSLGGKNSPGNCHKNLLSLAQLTYICDVYVESRLMTIHVEVMMIHDQWRLNLSTVIVQWKLVCHRTMATLYLRHYHGWILILEFFFNFVILRKNSVEVFALISLLIWFFWLKALLFV